ncbi:MAG: DM13 domain-containing protein [Proteobacteria bacterium]|nr:DM13 domain-containing protein [Pseudomonadota bacterium]
MRVIGFAAAVLAAPVAASAEGHVLASGEFRGQSGHAASGGVSVVKTAKGIVVVLGPDFKFDGAPDPKLGFGKNGYVKSTQFSILRSNSGKQTYEIPSTIEPADYTEVWVWCEKFSVPLGVATLR